jgi:hypothetical protein
MKDANVQAKKNNSTDNAEVIPSPNTKAKRAQ